MSSITEVVQTVKHPRSHSDEQQEPLPVFVPGTPSSNKSPVWDLKKEDARLSRRMSGRASLMGSVSLKDATHLCCRVTY
jgi:phototropin